MSEQMDRVEKLISDLSLDKCRPDEGFLDDILTLDVIDQLSNLPIKDVTNAIVILSQYFVTLTYNLNRLRVSKKILGKYIDNEVYRGIRDSGLVGTKDEKRRKFIDSREDLLKAENELESISSELLMLESYPESIKEYINALKKYRETLEIEMRTPSHEALD